MPLPKYQPVKKKLKTSGPSFTDLDDRCLSKIIGFALASSNPNQPYTEDNGSLEKNLSLVSRRWYFLTQTQVATYGVHRINLDEITKNPERSFDSLNSSDSYRTGIKTPRRLALTSTFIPLKTRTPGLLRKPNILTQRNIVTSARKSISSKKRSSTCPKPYNIDLFRLIQHKLLKYKHIQLIGTISADNFTKLVIALDSARIEQLDLLELKIENARSYLNSTAISTILLPSRLLFLHTLCIIWSDETRDKFSNALIWTIYERAVKLKELRVLFAERGNIAKNPGGNIRSAGSLTTESSIEAHKCLSAIRFNHRDLRKIIFNRSIEQVDFDSGAYSTLIKFVLSNESSVKALETNDIELIDHLVETSSRVCTQLNFKSLTYSTPIKNIDLLANIVRLPNLGNNFLSIVIDNIDQLSEMKIAVEDFKLKRSSSAKCEMKIFLKDQKIPDCDEKVKNLIRLCYLVDLTVHISALQRISIDCCHLMWSTGRALQASLDESIGKCIFKISLQTYPIRQNVVNPCEITVPFAKSSQYKIDVTREDISRHREIMKSLKRDCYHQFVKSIRDNVVP